MQNNNHQDLAILEVVPIAESAKSTVRNLRAIWFVGAALLGSATAVMFPEVTTYPALLKDYMQQRLAENAAPAAAPVAAPAPAVVADVKPLAPVPARPALQLPTTLTLQIKHGRTLGALLGDYNIANGEIADLVDSLRKVYNPRRLAANQPIELKLDKSASNPEKTSISGMTIKASPIRTIKVTRAGESFRTEAVDAPLEKALVHGGGIINSSLYETGIHAGMTPGMLAEIIKAFSYDVDFQRDIKEGDRLDVVFERKQTQDGHAAGAGDVYYASLTLGGKEKAIYHFHDKDTSGWFTKLGESIRKALLRTPINGAHITSGFGMRMHPLLGYSKMHKGVDFGAPTGTPIYAAGDGTIDFSGWKNGFGNYVEIQHTAKYATAYGHASRIARGIHPGVHVKQGQVIAYVGSTGQSTGPHLHYEVHINGEQVNPAGVKFKYGQTLGGRELAQFKRQRAQVDYALNKIPMNKAVAMNDIPALPAIVDAPAKKSRKHRRV